MPKVVPRCEGATFDIFEIIRSGVLSRLVHLFASRPEKRYEQRPSARQTIHQKQNPNVTPQRGGNQCPGGAGGATGGAGQLGGARAGAVKNGGGDVFLFFQEVECSLAGDFVRKLWLIMVRLQFVEREICTIWSKRRKICALLLWS